MPLRIIDFHLATHRLGWQELKNAISDTIRAILFDPVKGSQHSTQLIQWQKKGSRSIYSHEMSTYVFVVCFTMND